MGLNFGSCYAKENSCKKNLKKEVLFDLCCIRLMLLLDIVENRKKLSHTTSKTKSAVIKAF
jgi:hypothetical protein